MKRTAMAGACAVFAMVVALAGAARGRSLDASVLQRGALQASIVQSKGDAWHIWTPYNQFDEYYAVAFGLDGRVWLTDGTATILLRVNEQAKVRTVSSGSYDLEYMVRGGDGMFYATTGYSQNILRVTVKGGLQVFELGQPASGGMTATSDGSIWIPELAQVGRIQNGTIHEYPVPSGDLVAAGTSIARQAAGRVWFDALTPEGPSYLASLEPHTGLVRKHKVDGCGEAVLPIVAAPDARVWAVCQGVIDGFERNGGVVRVAWPVGLQFGMIGGYDNAIIGPDNAIWIAGAYVLGSQIQSGAVLRFDLVSHAFHEYVAPLGYEWPSGIAFDARGNLWAGTQNGQLQELRLRL